MYSFNLVFSGGGVSGLSMVGGISILENILINHFKLSFPFPKLFKQFVGTSAGSIVALLLNCGYNAVEIESEMLRCNYQDKIFQKNSFLNLTLHQYGLYSTEGLQDWIGDLIEKKFGKESRNLTFGELYEHNQNQKLMVISTEFPSMEMKVWSHETHYHTPVRIGVAASACYPIVFKPVFLSNVMYIDGGLTNFFPIDLIPKDELKNTIALEVVHDKHSLTATSDHHEENAMEIDLFSYFGKLFQFILDKADQNDQKHKQTLRQRCLYFPIFSEIRHPLQHIQQMFSNVKKIQFLQHGKSQIVNRLFVENFYLLFFIYIHRIAIFDKVESKEKKMKID